MSADLSHSPIVKAFFDETTFTVSYVIHDPDSLECAIIDSVLVFDPVSGRSRGILADDLIGYIQSNDLRTKWIIETHIHADHLSAAPYLKESLGGQTAVGSNVGIIQKTFADIYNVEADFSADGSQFDVLLDENSQISLGKITGKILHTPGHTPACITLIFGDAAFVGDTLFMPDYGTARCDFPGGCAKTLYRSIQKILTLPDEMRIFTCHDYKAEGRDQFAWESTVAEQRQNLHLKDKSEQEFVEMRQGRDIHLDLPRLLIPSVQVNMRAGELPPAESNGQHYLKTPIDML